MALPEALPSAQLSVLIGRVWHSSLTTGITLEERLGRKSLRPSRATARQLLGVDVYTCKSLARGLGVTTPCDLFRLFVQLGGCGGAQALQAGTGDTLLWPPQHALFCAELVSKALVPRQVAAHVAHVLGHVSEYAQDATDVSVASLLGSVNTPTRVVSGAGGQEAGQQSHRVEAVQQSGVAGSSHQPVASAGPTETNGERQGHLPSITSPAHRHDGAGCAPTDVHDRLQRTTRAPAALANGPGQPGSSGAVAPATSPRLPVPPSDAPRQQTLSHSASAPLERSTLRRLPVPDVQAAPRAQHEPEQLNLYEYFVTQDTTVRDRQRTVGLIRSATPVALGHDWAASMQRAWSPNATLRRTRQSRRVRSAHTRLGAPFSLHTLDNGDAADMDDEFEEFEQSVIAQGASALPALSRTKQHHVAWQQWASADPGDSAASTLFATSARPRSALGEAGPPPDVEAYITSCESGMELPVRAVMRRLQHEDVHLPHFRLGPGAATAFAAALSRNTTVKSLNLAGNSLSTRGSVALADALRVNNTLLRLDLSNAGVGAAAFDLFLALVDNNSLRQLSLKGNNISDVAGRGVGHALRASTTLTNLDLSFNQLGDETAKVLARSVNSCRLHTLNLKWNKVSQAGGVAMAFALRRNTALLLLDCSWNSLGEVGGLAFAEALAFNHSLRVLDLSQNRLTRRAALALADGVRLNTGLSDLQLNHNPISRAGATAVIHAVNHNKTVTKWGLTGVETRFQPTEDGHSFDPLSPNGHYRLNLAEPWDHAVATLLHARVINRNASWLHTTHNRRPVPETSLVDPAWDVPWAGRLGFDFVASDEAPRERKPIVHYVLNLGKPDEKRLARMLVQRAIDEPGENFLRETIDGVPFQFDEEQDGLAWIDGLDGGLLEFDFLSTALAHEAHYCLDLSVASANAVAYKLLERVYATAGTDTHGDRWRNATLDGRPFDLQDWRRGKQVGGVWVRGNNVTATGVKSAWRVPSKGILEFDFESRAPQHVFTQHYRLDLTKDRDRSVAHDLRVRASIVPGDNWWNERLDGIPFSLPEDFATPSADVLPRRGILEVDYVVTRPQETAKSMVTDHFDLNLSNAKDRALAKSLRLRAMESMFRAVREAEKLDCEAEREASLAAAASAANAAAQARESESAARVAAKRAKRAEQKRLARERRRLRGVQPTLSPRNSDSSDSSDSSSDNAGATPQRLSPAAIRAPSTNTSAPPTATPAVAKRATVVSDDEEEQEVAKVQPKQIFASLGMSLGLTVANDEQPAPKKKPPPPKAVRRRSKVSVLANLADGFGPAAPSSAGPPRSQSSLRFAPHALLHKSKRALPAVTPSAHGASTSLKRMATHKTLQPLDFTSLKRVDSKAALQDTPGEDEFVMNICLGGMAVSVQTFLLPEFVLPSTGLLSFDFVTFRGSDLVSPRDQQALVNELRKQVGDSDRLSLLEMVCQGSADTALFFDCSMGLGLLATFDSADAKETAVNVLLPRLRNPHRAGELHAAVAQAHQHELVLAKIVGSTPSKPTTQALKPGSGSRLPRSAKDTAPTKPKRRRN